MPTLIYAVSCGSTKVFFWFSSPSVLLNKHASWRERGLKGSNLVPVFGNVFKRPHCTWPFGQMRFHLFLIACNYLPHASQTLTLHFVVCPIWLARCWEKFNINEQVCEPVDLLPLAVSSPHEGNQCFQVTKSPVPGVCNSRSQMTRDLNHMVFFLFKFFVVDLVPQFPFLYGHCTIFREWNTCKKSSVHWWKKITESSTLVLWS